MFGYLYKPNPREETEMEETGSVGDCGEDMEQVLTHCSNVSPAGFVVWLGNAAIT